LDFSKWGDAFPDNGILGAATLDRLRHGAYRVVIEGESFRSPDRCPKTAKMRLPKRQKSAILKPFESAFYPDSAGVITTPTPGAIAPPRDSWSRLGKSAAHKVEQ
jgi:hypothetical protein